MKELMLKSKEQEGFELYIIDGDFSYFNDTNDSDIDFDNPKYTYNLFKILDKANKIGAFDKVKPDPDKSDENIETIYV